MISDRVRLPLKFDLPRIIADIASLPDEAWVPHFNTDIYEGGWSGIALRSVNGSPTQLYPDPTAAGDFADTAILATSPHLRDALAQFHCPLTSARLLALGPRAVINTHSDYRLAHEDGEVRLHVPLVTDPEVEFILDGQPVELAAGDCWYLNLNLPHSAANRSLRPRIHLVVDCIVNSWLDELVKTPVS